MYFLPTSFAIAFGDLGNFGVRIFFVISGFLITSLLLNEYKNTGQISLYNFYMRRLLRIFPAFYFFIAFLALWSFYRFIELNTNDLWFAVTYMSNYHRNGSWYVGHLWSLAVEEQFYILWPLVLVLGGPTKGKIFIVLAVLLGPAFRIIAWKYFPNWRGFSGKTFPTIFDAIATGCLLAYVRIYLHQYKGYLKFQRSYFFALIPLLAIFGLMTSTKFYGISSHLRESAINIAIALCIDRAVSISDGFVSHILNSKLFEKIGILSYSLYLWQQIFLNRNSTHWVARFPINIILTVLAAILSYKLIEVRFLKQKNRYR